ncbi:hypothetical protein FRB94_013907 [Tulasnella sp. JGI-2019a]|nr:hypothetical protein FRB94_013907 [Tulasnella sp. JGI-2019a]
MPSQVKSHESASPPSDRVLDKETDATKLAPISVLPEDVFTEIISIVSHPQDDLHPHDYVKRLHTMAQVCSTWASIIRRTPSLWSVVRFDAGFDGMGWITALKRSQSSRIAVECDLKSWKSPEPFWSAIITHSHRWASLSINAQQGSKWVKLAGVHAPFLEELSIYMSGEELDINRGNFPNLSAVTLTNVSLQNWTCGLLSGLRYLHFHLGHPSVRPPSIQQLFDMLAASPRLEHLRLYAMHPAIDNTSTRWPLISLPELRNITLGYLPVTAIDVILRSIHATHCPILSAMANLMSSQQLNIGEENFPSVSSLSLAHVGLRDWSSGLLSGLHFLNLIEISAFSPSLQQLLDVLAASPHLEGLHISEVALTIDDTSVRMPLITLPDLRNLSLVRLPTIVTDVILQSVHAAYCPMVELYHISETPPAPSIFPAIASFITPSLYRYFTTARAPITLRPWHEGFSFTVDCEKSPNERGRSFSISIGSFLVDTDAMIKWVDSLTESKTSNPHTLHFTVNFFDNETVDRVCASKWRLTHVDAITVRERGTELCQFLSSPIDLGNGGYGWPGPDVRKLAFDNSPELDAEVILEMVRRRMTASGGVDQNNLAPLEELVISGGSSIAKVPRVKIRAGKKQMTCESLMEAVRRIIAAETRGSVGDVAKQGSFGRVDDVEPDVIVS